MSAFSDAQMSKSQLEELRVLEFLYDDPKRGSGSLSPLDPLDAEIDDLRALARHLHDQGLIVNAEALAGPPHATITRLGVNEVERIRELRASTIHRNMAIRDAILLWLYEVASEGRGYAIYDEFWKTKYVLFYGEPYSGDSYSVGSEWLKSEGYIDGTSAMGDFVYSPRITPKGMKMVEQGASVNDLPNATTFNIANVGNLAHQSPGSTMNAVVNANALSSEIINALDQIAQALPVLGLPNEQQAEVAVLIEEAKSPELTADSGRVKAALDKITPILIAGGTALATGLGNQLAELVGR